MSGYVLRTVPGGVSGIGGHAPFLAAPLDDTVNTAISARLNFSINAEINTPNLPGTWLELDPSLSEDISGLTIVSTGLTSVTATNTSSALEIGIGASGSETVWATVLFGWINTHRPYVVIPGFIAAGTRIAIRARSAINNKLFVGVVACLREDSLIQQAPTTFNFNTANSRGLALTVPGAINTKGAWIEISASTPAAFRAISCTFGCNGQTVLPNANVLVDIGIGAAAAETVLIPDMHLNLVATELINQFVLAGPYAIDIAAGVRLSARYQTSDLTGLIDLVTVCA